MSQERQEYKGHRIELRSPAAAELGVRKIEGEAEPDVRVLVADLRGHIRVSPLARWCSARPR